MSETEKEPGTSHVYGREDRPPVWGYASAPDAEGWITAASREEAERIASTWTEDGGWIVEGRWIDPGKVAREVVDVDELLERMDEVEEIGGCFDGPLFETVCEGGAEALRNAVEAWAREYVACDRWIATGSPIHIPRPVA